MIKTCKSDATCFCPVRRSRQIVSWRLSHLVSDVSGRQHAVAQITMRPRRDSSKIRKISNKGTGWRASAWEGTCRSVRTVCSRTPVLISGYKTIQAVTRFTRASITSARWRLARHLSLTGSDNIACAQRIVSVRATVPRNRTDCSSRLLRYLHDDVHVQPRSRLPSSS